MKIEKLVGDYLVKQAASIVGELTKNAYDRVTHHWILANQPNMSPKERAVQLKACGAWIEVLIKINETLDDKE